LSRERKLRRRDARRLLRQVAAALNACEAAGIRVRLKHGAVITREGYVLPLGDGRWAARTLIYTEFTPPLGDDLDE
jgi:hypothetical protein